MIKQNQEKSNETLARAVIKNILIPRFDSLGDIILLEGFIERLIEVFPKANMTFLVREGYDQLASLFPEQLQWITTHLNPYMAIGDEDIHAIACFLNQMTEVPWDLVLVTTYNRTWLDDILAAKLTDAIKVTINDKPTKNERWFKQLLERLSLPTGTLYNQIIPVDEKAHETDKYQILCKALFKDNRKLSLPKFYISDDLIHHADHIISVAGLADTKYFVCATAGTQNIAIKTWPQDQFVDAISRINKKYGLHPLLTGHESERDAIESLAGLIENEGVKAFVWIGKTGEIPLLAAIMQKAVLYIGNDTGPLHVASAVGIPVVGIYGGGTWPRFTPVSDNAIAVVGSLPCFGCYWDCIFKDAPCMSLVGITDVIKAIEMVLGNNGPSERILYSENKVAKEAQTYIDKVKPYIKESIEDRAARLEAIKDLQWQLQLSETDRLARLASIEELQHQLKDSESDRSARLEAIIELQSKLLASEADRAARLEGIQGLQRQLQASEADRSARLEAIEELQRQLQASEADRAARLEAIYSLQARIDILSRPETVIRTTIIILLKKLKLYKYFARHHRLFSQIYSGLYRYASAKKIRETGLQESPASAVAPSIESPIVEALVNARGIDGDMDETAMVDLFERGTKLSRILCIDPSPSDMQAIVMLSRAGASVTYVSSRAEKNQLDLQVKDVKTIPLDFAKWMMTAGQTTFPEYDGLLLGNLVQESTIFLLKGKLWPQTCVLTNRVGSKGHPISRLWGVPDHTLNGLDIYENPPDTWIDPAHANRHYYQQKDWPWVVSPIKGPPLMPSGRPWPKISVVTVTFNQGMYLEETLRSVIAQGYPNLEYILIDGGSTDETQDIIKRYQSELSYCISEKDEGQSHALNKGFQQASGDILAWLNSDDCYLPGALWRVALAFDTYTAEIVAGGCALRKDLEKNFLRIHHNAMPVGNVVPLPLDRLLDIEGSWQKGDFFYQPEVFWKRSIWEKSGGYVKGNLFYSMDYELWLRFALNGGHIVHIPDTLALFRMHDNQKTTGEVPPFLSELRSVSADFKRACTKS